MRTLDIRRLMATVAAAALIGAVAGSLSPDASTAAIGRTATAQPTSYCGSGACESLTWLRMPALRRAR